jgi:hypothetical protein
MGALVGAAVGAAVGVAVGTAVGVVVGAVVGEAVGDADGFAVGTVVGVKVGAAVGFALGTTVGLAVGEAVGTGVGAFDFLLDIPRIPAVLDDFDFELFLEGIDDIPRLPAFLEDFEGFDVLLDIPGVSVFFEDFDFDDIARLSAFLEAAPDFDGFDVLLDIPRLSAVFVDFDFDDIGREIAIFGGAFAILPDMERLPKSIEDFSSPFRLPPFLGDSDFDEFECLLVPWLPIAPLSSFLGGVNFVAVECLLLMVEGFFGFDCFKADGSFLVVLLCLLAPFLLLPLDDPLLPLRLRPIAARGIAPLTPPPIPALRRLCS